MKTAANRMKLRRILLSVVLCFLAYLSLAGVLFDLNWQRPLVG